MHQALEHLVGVDAEIDEAGHFRRTDLRELINQREGALRCAEESRRVEVTVKGMVE